ncbi:multiubiquitin domain-containing protein [Acidithiobacillus ferriphilus]|uniref:multiubiquitin domain-containing protein n=1 Tax=Acidithiobacillus ferriphilus TaxID=1689834 RepID=UPI00232B1CDB|nr:multiubiquitin domain-containing protein [Acidithiobacillus ferriphilus]WCE94057.1 multiubiquitin domain-containing protein [Acidithiobacillus ferriphilus]
MENHHVQIHVDQKPHQSSTPTTGADLYELLDVPDGRVLYREVSGNTEDKPVRIDEPHVLLVEDEHFHVGEAPENYYLIRVNTEPFIVEHQEVTFDQVVKLAYPTLPGGLDPEFTVSFEHAKSTPHHGDLAKNGKVEVKKLGTLFDVGHTNRS